MSVADERARSWPWDKSYPGDVDWRAEIPVAPLPSLFDEAVRRHGDRPAIDFLDRRLSYAALGRLVDRAAKGFQGIGVAKGVRVGLLLPNCPAFVICYFGILKAGGTVVNYNPLYAEAEIRSQIEDSETNVLITLDLAPLFAKAHRMLGATRLKQLVVCGFAAELPAHKGLLFRLAKRKLIARVPQDERILKFAALLRNDGRFRPEPCDPARDIALLQYTGGTTGLPKAAMLTHANVSANARQALLYFPQTRPGQEIMLGVLPLFHVFAMTVCMNFSVFAGALMVLLPRFEIEQLLKTIRRKRPTFMPAVPTIYIAINTHKEVVAGRHDFSSLRICISGGAAMPLEVMTTFEQLTRCQIVEGYGLSETSPIAIVNPSTGVRRPGSLGLPVPGTVVEITAIDEPDRVLAQGERGEICLRGPQVMLGYWKRSEESERALQGGRFHTGDIGYVDPDGYTFLIDRMKDIILSGGYSVFPRHVEEAIYQHPAVEEVTVIGVPDAYRQETPKAFVRLRAGETLSAEALTAFLKERLSPIELPREIEFRAELPKTLVGKLSKKELVAEEAARRKANAGS
jgi:long-chain acyl-CoA synthetase